MHTLIDGYNLMYAAGLLGKRFGPDGFRKVRTRFLNDLAGDARRGRGAPDDRRLRCQRRPRGTSPASRRTRESRSIFAVDDDRADERIDELIAAHSVPKTLTVVSSDHRIRAGGDPAQGQVDLRRRVPRPARTAQGARDAALDRLGPRSRARLRPDRRGGRLLARRVPRGRPSRPRPARSSERDPIFPTDEEIARIEREVEEEFATALSSIASTRLDPRAGVW